MKRLLIDCQILQTPAFHRGMGKYTTRLLGELLKLNASDKTYDEVTVIFNKKLEDRSKSIKKELTGASINFINGPVDISTNVKEKYAEATDKITALAKKYTDKGEEVDYLITSPFFMGFPAVFPDLPEVNKYSVVYDLIPYKIWHLQRIFPDDIYAQHFKLFIEADHLFSISNAVKDDLIKLLGISKSKISSIDGGPFMDSTQSKGKASLKLGLKKPYILFLSAPIIHKNNERAVVGFEEFRKQENSSHTLYITSTFDEETQRRLQDISPNIEFTGNIGDEELVSAYKEADAVMFASLTEGLGMPVLESVVCGVPVACSNIPVLTEISDTGFYIFNPLEPGSIAQALSAATKREDWPAKRAAHRAIKTKYSWERSAEVLLSRLKKISKNPAPKRDARVRMQMDSPLAQETALGRFGEALYAPLRETFAGVEVVAPKINPEAPSYAAYLECAKAVPAPTVTLRLSKKKSFNFTNSKQKIYIRLLLPGQPEKHKIITATPFLLDEALDMKGWHYRSDGIEINSQDLVKWVTDSVTKQSQESSK